MTYRNIALDLEPGRVENAKARSAQKRAAIGTGTFYMRSGGLRDVLASDCFGCIKRVAKPKIKGLTVET